MRKRGGKEDEEKGKCTRACTMQQMHNSTIDTRRSEFLIQKCKI